MWSSPAPLTFEQQVTSLKAPPDAKGPFPSQNLVPYLPARVEFGWAPQPQAFPPGLLRPGQPPTILRGVIRFPQNFPACGYAPEVSILFPDPASLPPWELRHHNLVPVQGGYSYHGGELAAWRAQDAKEHGNLGWVMCRVMADLNGARVAARPPAAAPPPVQPPQPKTDESKLPAPVAQPPTQLPAVPPTFPQLESLDRGALEALLAESPEGAAAREGLLLASVHALTEFLDKERLATRACEAMAARAQEEAGRVAAAAAGLAAAGEAARAAHAAAEEARARLQGTAVRPEALLERMRKDEAQWKAEADAARTALATPAGWAAAGGGGGGALSHHSAYLALRTKVHTVRHVREHLARALGGGAPT